MEGGWFGGGGGGIVQGCGVFKYQAIQPHQGRGRDREDWWCWRQTLVSWETWAELSTTQTPGVQLVALGKPARCCSDEGKTKEEKVPPGLGLLPGVKGIKGAGLALVQHQHLPPFLSSTPVTGQTSWGGGPPPPNAPGHLHPASAPSRHLRNCRGKTFQWQNPAV